MPPRYPHDREDRPRSMGETCRKLGLDDDGERCPSCPLQALCVDETRWLVCRTERPRFLN